MDNMSSSLTVTNCAFSVNSAVNQGGAMNISGSSMVTNCTFMNNTAKTGHPHRVQQAALCRVLYMQVSAHRHKNKRIFRHFLHGTFLATSSVTHYRVTI
jgi:hypothetical protein